MAGMDRAKMVEQRAIQIEKYGTKTIHETKLPNIVLN